MEGTNSLTDLSRAMNGGPPPTPGPPFLPDSKFALAYEAFIIFGIFILMLSMLPQIIHFLGSQRKQEVWWLHQSGRPNSATSDINTIHITKSKAELSDGEIGANIISTQVHNVTFPELCHTDMDNESSASRKGEYPEKVQASQFAERATVQHVSPQRQGAILAYIDWMGAKMTKFIGGPISMHLGPWLVVLVINVVANALVALAPPFFVAPDRSAHIAVAQIPILFVLGTKNNILSCILGKSYEKLNFVHRTVGRLLFIFSTLHAIGHLIKCSTRGAIGQVMKAPWVQAGLVAWIGLILVTFASVGIVRIKFYEFFLNSHMIGILVFMIALHFRGCMRYLGAMLDAKPALLDMPAVVMPYTLSGLVFYLIDLVFRACKMRVRSATISAIDDQMTLIAIHGIDDGWRAGQHVWLRILQGERSWESHPFTIANAPASHTPDTGNSKGLPSRGLLLYARVAGNFTRTLNLDARQSSGIQTNVIVDGPYGGLGAGIVNLADSRNVVLVAGGGGASFTIALLENLVSCSLQRKARTTVVDFLWVVKEYDHLNWYMSTIKQIALAASSSSISLQIRLYVTQLETAPNGKLDRPLPPLPNQSILDPEGSSTIDIIFKRPDLPALIGEAVNYAVLAGQSNSGAGGMSISVCGPVPMIKDVQLAARRISIKDRRLAGGVFLHTESFGL
ncbi:unnamed protein product [Rhizoctonia solani]|uniref:FAD-binding FR-type domain-containing protein n=1 Tax=Rhizoctonia solani TaxID=456999 RepID=A0A8H3E8U7_9AGAM|nr:unnamed protein product [Rhizoctonia solani]